MEQQEFTPTQAINLLHNVTGQMPLKRDEHNAVLQALQVLATAAGLQEKKEEVKS